MVKWQMYEHPLIQQPEGWNAGKNGAILYMTLSKRGNYRKTSVWNTTYELNCDVSKNATNLFVRKFGQKYLSTLTKITLS